MFQRAFCKCYLVDDVMFEQVDRSARNTEFNRKEQTQRNDLLSFLYVYS